MNNEKRFGMFAIKDIPSGTIIINEKPILSVPKERMRINNKSCEEYINQQFELLSNNDKKRVLDLHNNINNNNINDDHDDDKKNDVVGCYRTNAYMFTNDDNQNLESGLFVDISRINHSCFPNAQFVDNSKNGTNLIIALFGINKGDEITHSYFSLDLFMMNTDKRQKYILENYGFICKCDECQLFKKRDQFRKKYQDFEQEMEKGFEQGNEAKIMECATKMVDILKKNFNGYPPLLSQGYMRLAEAKLHSGAYEQVVDYMKRSAKLDIKYYGDGCDMNDIIQCKIMLPIKYQNIFCWDHVLGASRPT